jgi:hypothetical protein
MIVLFANRGFRHTHNPLQERKEFDFRVWPYSRLFRAVSLPVATYIFSDLDRLHWWDLEMAARSAHHLRDAGLRVLNDPARASQRYHLLTRLYREGINDFAVWHAGERPPHSAYPVFLRTESGHRGPLTDRLFTPEALEKAEQELLTRGIPERELMIVQYWAEPIEENLFRKLGTFRVAETLVPTLCAHEDDWQAKLGQTGIAGQAWYDDENRIVNGHRHAGVIRAAFEAGSIEYGRADFGLVRGRPAIYEIKTNPMIRRMSHHPFPIRFETDATFHRNLATAVARIDGPPSGPKIRMPKYRALRRQIRDIWQRHLFRRVPPMP